MKSLRLLLCIIVCIGVVHDLRAQSESVRVTIRAVQVYSTYNASNEAEDYRFRFWLNNDETSSSCLKLNNRTHHQWLDVNYTLVSNGLMDLSENITIAVNAWEEDNCKDDCRYNDTDVGCDDGGLCSKGNGTIQPINFGAGFLSGSTFKLINLPPGNAGNIIEIWYCTNGKYRVRYSVTYQPPQPDQPSIFIEDETTAYNFQNPPRRLCDELNITLKTATSVNPVFNSQVQYSWEYRIDGETTTVLVANPAYCGDSGGCLGGENPLAANRESGSESSSAFLPPEGELPPCCFEPPFIEQEVEVWRSAGSSIRSSNGDNYTFDVRALNGLQNITKNTVVNFRVRIVSNSSSGPYSSVSVTLNLSPPPPTIDQITSDPSCPNYNSGVIYLTNVNGVGQYQYIIKPGFDNNSPCNPETNGSCFSGSYSGGPVSGPDFNVESIEPGQYTFWLANPGGNQGSCYSTRNIEVLKIPELSIEVVNKVDISCNGNDSGEIELSKTGGRAPYTFTINAIGSNDTGLFPNLTAGEYVTSVTDGCNQSLPSTTRNIILKQPKKLSATLFEDTEATCVNPGNGEMNVAVVKSNGTYDSIVSNTYLYQLVTGGSAFASWESLEATSFRNTLPVGDYELIVTEKGSQECNAFKQPFTIDPPPPLAVSDLVRDSVTCFGGDDGRITFNASGGSGLYLFKLTKAAGDTLQQTNGVFSNLLAGDYQLVIENNLLGCQDKANHPDLIKVEQPNDIAFALSKTDVTCFEYYDGSIAASVTGGTPNYQYRWQQLFDNTWSTINTSTSSISDLGPGEFRLSVVDQKNCPDSSESVIIIEPAKLLINNVTVNDIRCFGEQGTMDVQAIGGVMPYAFKQSYNGSGFTLFTNSTPLNEGNYIVSVTDNNGCAFVHPDVHMITAPPEALDFTYVQSDFNGYNISCYGGSNGSITITAFGGNGNSYNGYQYASGIGAYQGVETLTNFNAGSHAIHVRDGRGCVVTKDIPFTQTNALLEVSTASKQDVVCYGDLTGKIDAQGTGGLAPYQFSLNASPKQAETLFSNLGVGNYQIVITDLNGCTASYMEQIVNLNPRIEMEAAISHVNCFGGQDGSIILNVTDGVQPFQFSWTGQSSTSHELTGIGVGTYAVRVTDNAGCKRDSAFTISQPQQALRLHIATVPVCYDRTNGVITLTVGGGTSPYQYSVNNGQSYQNYPVFTTVGVGNYPVKVIDNNGCTITGTTEVVKRNDRPEPNFLVATRQNALDTLIIKEISVPKPDSINWLFDPNAIIINADQWSPQIRFNEAGTYFISMTGFFAGCDYAILKSLTLNPYDPNAGSPADPGLRAIQTVEVTPNPNTGQFDVTVKLLKKYNLSLVVHDILGGVQYSRQYTSVQEVAERVALSQVASGVYLLRVITDNDARDVRIIINK